MICGDYAFLVLHHTKQSGESALAVDFFSLILLENEFISYAACDMID